MKPKFRVGQVVCKRPDADGHTEHPRFVVVIRIYNNSPHPNVYGLSDGGTKQESELRGLTREEKGT
jgi:hypothetical protein